MLQVPKLLNGQSGIYLIQNKETGKFYIGSSNNLKNRFRQHNQMLDRLATGWRPPTGHNKITVRHVPSGKLFDSLTEAADFAGVSLTTIHRWVKGRPDKGKRVGFNFDWRLE